MAAKIINGKAIAAEIQKDLAMEVREFEKRYNVIPTLAVILVGYDAASKVYVEAKEKASQEVGIRIKKYEFPDIKEANLIKLIQKLNKDKNVHGILVQLPLPPKLNKDRILAIISRKKDVDGFSAFNVGNLLIGKEDLVPCTPLGIITMLEKLNINLEGKDVVIINHSRVIGKPLAMLLTNRFATVSICHVKTKDLRKYTKQADILITATGVPELIKRDMVKKGAVVIDAGIKRVKGKIYGDVDFEPVKEIASFITPVPGGVGPLTVAMVLKNTLIAAKNLVGE